MNSGIAAGAAATSSMRWVRVPTRRNQWLEDTDNRRRRFGEGKCMWAPVCTGENGGFQERLRTNVPPPPMESVATAGSTVGNSVRRARGLPAVTIRAIATSSFQQPALADECETRNPPAMAFIRLVGAPTRLLVPKRRSVFPTPSERLLFCPPVGPDSACGICFPLARPPLPPPKHPVVCRYQGRFRRLGEACPWRLGEARLRRLGDGCPTRWAS